MDEWEILLGRILTAHGSGQSVVSTDESCRFHDSLSSFEAVQYSFTTARSLQYQYLPWADTVPLLQASQASPSTATPGLPGMAGSGNVRLSRGEIHPHTTAGPASDLLPSAIRIRPGSFSFHNSFSFSLLFFTVSVIFVLAEIIASQTAQHESRSDTPGEEPGAEARLCEHAPTARQLCLYRAWPDGEFEAFASLNCTPLESR